MLEEVYHCMGFIQLHASSWSSFIPLSLASCFSLPRPLTARRGSLLPVLLVRTYVHMDYDLGTHEHFSMTPLQAKIERSNHPTKDCKLDPSNN